MLIGAPLAGRVLIVDDVVTAGTAIRESIGIIKASGATPAGVLIALDRQERGQRELSAALEVEREFSVPVIAIARLHELLAFADERAELHPVRAALQAYRREYGVSSS
jgi:orotate phosphoribosyltransferase